MLPQGVIWQHLRQRALAVIPAGCHISHANPQTLRSWLQTGAFTVNSASSNAFGLNASSQEFGGALFSEASFLLDHASEHSVTVRNQLVAGGWHSAAWLVVTFYYWSFYLALSITRILGKTAWFLTKKEAGILASLASTELSSSGPGPYTIECGDQLTLSQVEIRLKKAARTRLHDLVWRLVFDEIRTMMVNVRGHVANELEQRLFNALLNSSNTLGQMWPSELRNLVNYGLGVGYGAVRRTSRIEVFKTIAIERPVTFEAALDRLENNVMALSPGRALLDQIGGATKVLIDLTFVLDGLARALHGEIVERHSFDRRWPNARNEFLSQQFRNYAVQQWPYHG